VIKFLSFLVRIYILILDTIEGFKDPKYVQQKKSLIQSIQKDYKLEYSFSRVFDILFWANIHSMNEDEKINYKRLFYDYNKLSGLIALKYVRLILAFEDRKDLQKTLLLQLAGDHIEAYQKLKNLSAKSANYTTLVLNFEKLYSFIKTELGSMPFEINLLD
jgi:hypothetical protein